MNPNACPAARPHSSVAWWRRILVVVLTVLLASCGGGVGTGGTGTYASGPITGLGSIIVNDVRFDESTATVVDDDGGSRLRTELRLGMTVDIDAGAVRTSGSESVATATRVRFGSELLGPVQAVDIAGGRFTVLGQTVRVAVDTVLDASLSGGLGALAAGQWVEVYAQFDPSTGAYDATRVEPKSVQAQARLRGPVVSVDTAASTLRLGGADFAYAGATGVPADLAAGRFVRLRVAPAPVAGRYTVIAFGVALRAPEDRDEARLRGRITAFASTASFSINGLAVDASAANFPDGTAGLRVGARVEAEGTSSGGVLRATQVRVETEDEREERGFELKGAVESVDLAASTVVVRGTSVSLARPGLQLQGGVLTDLAVGRQVEIKAALSADRTRLEATSIRFR